MFFLATVFSQVVFPCFLIAAALLHETGNTTSLSCDKVVDNQMDCNATTWLFKSSRKTDQVTLATRGQIVSTELNKVRRLRLLGNCSLEIKNMTVEDSGVYYCRQHLSKEKTEDAPVELALISSKSFTPQILVDQSVQQLLKMFIFLVVTFLQ